MIVDDNKEFLEELEQALILSGYDVIAVSDASRVLEVALKTRPELMLLDIKMPKKSGFQIADAFKRSSLLRRIPIIVMTGFFTDNYFTLMNICRIQKRIQKPFNCIDLIAKIETLLSKNTLDN